MAVNEKVTYAREWTTYGGRIFRPGEQMSGRVPDHALRGAQESGLTTDSHAEAERSKRSEAERKAGVQREIATRSIKRDHRPPEDHRS